MIHSHQRAKFDRLYDQLTHLENSNIITLTAKEVCADMISHTPAGTREGENCLYLDPCCGKGTILYHLYIELWDTLSITDIEEKNRRIMGCLYGCDNKQSQLDIARALLKKAQRVVGVRNVMEPNLKLFDTLDEQKPFPDKKFTVVIANPPYNGERRTKDLGHNRSYDIYPEFVEKAYELSSRYVIMITKSSWMVKKQDMEFRNKMVKTFKVSKIHQYPNNPFDGTEIKGGVSYFVIDKKTQDDTFMVNGIPFDRKKSYDSFIPYSLNGREVMLLNKLKSMRKIDMTNYRSENYYSIKTNDKKLKAADDGQSKRVLVSQEMGNVRYISTSCLTSKAIADLPKPKVFTPKAYAPYKMGRVEKSTGDEICSQSMICWVFDTQEEMEAFYAYTQTKLFRFCFSLISTTHTISKKSFSLIPHIDYMQMKTIDDSSVYAHLGFTDEEIDIIENRCSCLKLL